MSLEQPAPGPELNLQPGGKPVDQKLAELTQVTTTGAAETMAEIPKATTVAEGGAGSLDNKIFLPSNDVAELVAAADGLKSGKNSGENVETRAGSTVVVADSATLGKFQISGGALDALNRVVPVAAAEDESEKGKGRKKKEKAERRTKGTAAKSVLGQAAVAPEGDSSETVINAETNPKPEKKLEAPAKNENVTIPVIITRDMKQQLVDRGVSRENIGKLKPEEAWEMLNSKKKDEGKEEKINKPEKKIYKDQA